MAGAVRERLIAVTVGILLTAPGCLTWSLPDVDDDDSGDDDDSTVGDDDDSTVGDDDDSTAGDDDDSTAGDDDDSVPLEANGVIAVVVAADLGGGDNAGGVAGGIFSNALLSPSAEEAAYEDAVGFPILTFADPGDFRDSAGALYDASYLTGASNISIEGVGGAVTMVPSGAGWAAQEFDATVFPAAEPWTADILEGPFAGLHDGPDMPAAPAISSDRLLGGRLYLQTTETTVLQWTDAEPGTTDVLSFLAGGDDGAFTSRVYMPEAEGAVRVDGLGGLSEGGAAQMFVQRTRRGLVQIGTRSLLLSSAWFGTASVYALASQDRFLSPNTAPDWSQGAGTPISFQVDPPDLVEGGSFTIEFLTGASSVEGTYSGGTLSATIDPAALGFGWVDIQVALPSGGVGRGALQIGGEAPACDVNEAGANDTIADAGTVFGGQVVCGTVDPAGDLDTFRVDTTLGVTYVFETWARRIGSQADTILTVFDEDGQELNSNDDWFGLDSRVVVAPSTPGPLFVQVRNYDAVQSGPDLWWRLVTTSSP